MSHLKSFFVPKSWTLRKKENVFVVRPKPGAHPSESSVPLAHMLRTLGLASTVREIKQVLKSGGVIVDGRPVKDYKMPVGFMDSVHFRPLNRTYRLFNDPKGRITYVDIDAADAGVKVVKVRGKSAIKEGKIQLTTSDGRSIISDVGCAVGDSLLITVPFQKVEKVLKLEKGARIYLTGGRHRGTVGTVEDVKGDRLFFKSGKETLETLKGYALVIGDFKVQ